MSKLQDALAGQKPATAYEIFRAQVSRLRPEIAGLCGQDNVDRFVRVCLNAVQSNPDVLEADRRSLLIACLKAAQDNLLPDGREAVFTIFNTKVKKGNTESWVKLVQYMPMAYGLVQKIYEAGALLVDAVPVFKEDDFKYQRGDEPHIFHVPYAGDGSPGDVVAAYVIVKLKTGETKREVIFRRDIEKSREASKAPNGMMWKDWYDQGAVKTVIHRVAKQLPRAESLARALANDREVTGLKDVTGEVVNEAPTSPIEALVDGRLQGELHDAVLKARTGDVTEVKTDPKVDSKTVEAGEGTVQQRDSVIMKLREASTTDAAAEAMDSSKLFKWTVPDATMISAEYQSALQRLKA